MAISSGIPAAAWKRRLDSVLEHPGHAPRRSLTTLLQHLPEALRVSRFDRQMRRAGRIPYMSVFDPLDPGPYMGVPLGGLGSGTITRGWQGDFPRWQMQPGMYRYATVPADQFSVHVYRPGRRPRLQTLYPGQPQGGGLEGWAWNLPGRGSTYYALYPRAWTVYEEIDPELRLTCRQVSPFIPHNYRQSSTPAGVFVWTIENTGSTPATVGLMFSFQNGTGGDNDYAGGHFNTHFTLEADGGPVSGVALHHRHRQPRPPVEGEPPGVPQIVEGDPLTFAIAAQAREGVRVTYRTRFVSNSSGMDLWGDFRDGALEDVVDERRSLEGMSIGAAVCATVEVPPGETREAAFALAWDMPLARFGDGRAYWRRYTRSYGRDGKAAPRIARDALLNYPDWETQIAAWQEPVLDDPRLPDWYKCALFNETYFLADGGTVWVDEEQGADPLPEDDIGHFLYLEGHEYLMYNTYDVHFYASFALAALWPELELSLQRDFARAVEVEHPETVEIVFSGHSAPRKVRGAAPHDLGGPTEDPWRKTNIYNFQDANRWKDLNSKFVLQVYRDLAATQDIEFAAEMWPAVVTAMEYLKQFDEDGDGLIENGGFPDQTYDTWRMKGPSAYCGGLWLAALSAAAALGEMLGQSEQAAAYRSLLERGKRAYEELLWTGEYYAYDASGQRHSNSVMADQLAGDWYARACGLPPVVPDEHARSALKKVFDLNVMQFEGGEMGAVNGMRPNGRVDTTTIQSQEVWSGTTYAVAAAMLQVGLVEEAFTTAKGVYLQTYERLGYWFMTPEAWTAKGVHRSLAYMRPLAIWAMQWAWQRQSPGEAPPL